MNLQIILPSLNAFFNFCSFVFLLLGFKAIRAGLKEKHVRYMFSACVISFLFLVSYVYYHLNFPSRVFPQIPIVRTLYLLLLASHVILAALNVPLVAMTLFYAFRKNDLAHKKVARLTFPVWLYVSVTGVIVYLLLYQIYS